MYVIPMDEIMQCTYYWSTQYDCRPYTRCEVNRWKINYFKNIKKNFFWRQVTQNATLYVDTETTLQMRISTTNILKQTRSFYDMA